MGKFLNLLKPDNSLAPGEQQRLAYERFPSTVASGPMSLWRPGDPIPTNGTRILIGVATYSMEELKLLDAIESKLSIKNDKSQTIQLFNVLDCTHMDDFENYIPGIGKVYQTPVLGVWENGILQYKTVGSFAIKWLTLRFDLSS